MNEISQIEKAVSPEILKPRIRLEFFRHDKGEAETNLTEDRNRRLLHKARINASEAGKKKEPNPKVAFAYGSPRVRAQETALRQLLAKEEGFGSELSFGELDQEVRGKMSPTLQGKVRVLEQLDFRDNCNPKYLKEAEHHYAEVKDAIPFHFYESDKLVEELGDMDDYSYSRLAANVAELVKKYVAILPRWGQILAEKQKEYEGITEMQRFFGTHGTVAESFLIKAVEKTEGWDAADKFVREMPDKNCFPLSEGISVIIKDNNGTPVITIRYRDKVFSVTESNLDEMLRDRDALNQRIREKLLAEK